MALAGKLLDAPAVIVMPYDAPGVKMRATREYGAEIILYDRVEQSREEIARRLCDERGLSLVPPFDHPYIIAGQGTAALELVTDVPDLDMLLAPVGGGGLISGCSIAAHALRPQMRVIGVEPENANDAFLSLQKGERVTTSQAQSVGDGLLPTAPGKITFPIMRQHLDSIALISDHEMIDAVFFLLERLKILVEPSGAAPVAALMSGHVTGLAGKKIGVILSGGNIDPLRLAEFLAGNHQTAKAKA